MPHATSRGASSLVGGFCWRLARACSSMVMPRPGSLESWMKPRVLESNVMYFATMVLAALFLFNWLNLLVNGASEVGEEVMHDVVWVVVDVMIILVSGATGGYLLRSSSN